MISSEKEGKAQKRGHLRALIDAALGSMIWGSCPLIFLMLFDVKAGSFLRLGCGRTDISRFLFLSRHIHSWILPPDFFLSFLQESRAKICGKTSIGEI